MCRVGCRGAMVAPGAGRGTVREVRGARARHGLLEALGPIPRLRLRLGGAHRDQQRLDGLDPRPVSMRGHVVQRSSLLSVHFADGQRCRAKVHATSEPCDLALLSLVTCAPRPALHLAAAAPLVGEEVLALGHPGTWAWLAGSGTVTGVGRQSSRALQKWQAPCFSRHFACLLTLFDGFSVRGDDA